MVQEKEYFAFISYKREDEKWAKWLAHELEHYHLPTTLNGKDLPKNLRPIFRDVDELSAGNLPTQIYNALSISKNLIVVCSPRSAKSEWVDKEIEDFLMMKGGKADNIYPFIIEGVPFSEDAEKECFPRKLRNLPKNEERLGGNINEQGGRKAAVVKIIAGMLDLEFDSLWRKHEKEKQKKNLIRLIIAAIAFIICLTVSAYIFRQQVILSESKKQEMFSLTKRLASFAMEAQEKGDMRLAMLLLLESVSLQESDSLNLLPETESALNHILYGDGNSFFNLIASFQCDEDFYFFGKSDKLIAVDNSNFILRNIYSGEEQLVAHHIQGDYLNLTVSPYGKYIAVSDYQSHSIYVFSGQYFQELSTIKLPISEWLCTFSHDEKQLAILGNHGMLYKSDEPYKSCSVVGSIGEYDSYFGKFSYLSNEHSISFGNILFNIDSQKETIFSNDTIEFENLCDEYGLGETFISYGKNGDFVVKAYSGDYKSEYKALGNYLTSIEVFDSRNGSILCNAVLRDAIWEDEHVRDIEISNDNKYIAVTYSNKVTIFEYEVSDWGCYMTEIQSINTGFEYLKEVAFNSTNDKIMVSTLGGNQVLFYGISKRDYKRHKEVPYKTLSDIKSDYIYLSGDNNSGYYIIDTKAGEYSYRKIDDGHVIKTSIGGAVAYNNNDKIVVLDCNGTIKMQEEIMDTESFDISSDGTKLVILTSKSINYYDIKTGNITKSINCPNNEHSSRKIHFSGNDEWIVVQEHYNNVSLFSISKDLTLYKSIYNAFDAIISNNKKYLSVYRRFDNEYFSIEEFASGVPVFSTQSHSTPYEGGNSLHLSFNNDCSKILVSSFKSHEIYDVKSGIMVDNIINSNYGIGYSDYGIGYWQGDSLYSVGGGILFYPMESSYQKVNKLRNRLGNEILTEQERIKYGITNMK